MGSRIFGNSLRSAWLREVWRQRDGPQTGLVISAAAALIVFACDKAPLVWGADEVEQGLIDVTARKLKKFMEKVV